MNTPTGPSEGQAALFGDPQPETTPVRGTHPPGRHPAPGPAAEPSLEPSRWVMVGWRDARGVIFTREQQLAVFNTPEGPCARCGATHHRYGHGGQPLCPACRTLTATKE